MRKTNIKLRNMVIYQIYVRNFSESGDFQAIVEELDRIKSLGVDYVYLLPIHPIGQKNKKGSKGCPYSIKDYSVVSEELGGLSGFKTLIEEIHQRKMKVMMDIVFNHTSRDSRLLEEHPEWFYRNELGEITNRVGEWWDVYDLNYSADKALYFELLNVLVEYARLGVDGYRCDVASMIPLDFWELARKQIKKINPRFIWLSESIHGHFCKYIRDEGFECASEAEIYQVFDMAYDYDIMDHMHEYLGGKSPLKPYLEGLKRQDEIYPANYIKMHNIENHDVDRIAAKVNNDLNKIMNWNAFMFMQKGSVMLYMGQEYAADIRPSLFEKELFIKNHDLTPFFKKLTALKKKKVFASGKYYVEIPEVDGVAYQIFDSGNEEYHGLFNVGQIEGNLPVKIKDGKYKNFLSNKYYTVRDGVIKLSKEPVILRCKK